MYECWALISVHNGYDREWTKGWDCGTYKATGATAFRPEYNMEAIFYVAEEDLCYDKYPEGMCDECLMIGFHKLQCDTGYWEKVK